MTLSSLSMVLASIARSFGPKIELVYFSGVKRWGGGLRLPTPRASYSYNIGRTKLNPACTVRRQALYHIIYINTFETLYTSTYNVSWTIVYRLFRFRGTS